MKRFTILFLAVFLTSLLASQAAFAGLTGYLKIPDIPGESTDKDHKDWIDLDSFFYPAIREISSGNVGRGRARSQAIVGPVELSKWADSASVYLNLATLQGRVFDEIVVDLVRPDGSLEYRYTFQNVTFVSFTSASDDREERTEETMGITFEVLTVLYIEQNRDGSAGDEHEITYDIAAGV